MQNVKAIDFPGLMFVSEVPFHDSIKIKFLEIISRRKKTSINQSSQKISDTDFFDKQLPNTEPVDYNFLSYVFKDHLDRVSEILGYKRENYLELKNIWFQQYEINDFHCFHVHGLATFSSVYYLELPQFSSKTTFKFFDKEFEVPIREGIILTFPSYLLHASKPNKCGRKTVVAFNSLIN